MWWWGLALSVPVNLETLGVVRPGLSADQIINVASPLKYSDLYWSKGLKSSAHMDLCSPRPRPPIPLSTTKRWECKKKKKTWHICWVNTDVSGKSRRWSSCQSSSPDVLICGSGLGHRQIILELMVVLSCRLTMGYHCSCVSMQMWTRIYTNAQCAMRAIWGGGRGAWPGIGRPERSGGWEG